MATNKMLKTLQSEGKKKIRELTESSQRMLLVKRDRIERLILNLMRHKKKKSSKF